MLICILTKNVITSCSVTMMLFLHLEVKPLMTLTTVRSEERFSRNAETELVCRLLLEKKNRHRRPQPTSTRCCRDADRLDPECHLLDSGAVDPTGVRCHRRD